MSILSALRYPFRRNNVLNILAIANLTSLIVTLCIIEFAYVSDLFLVWRVVLLAGLVLVLAGLFARYVLASLERLLHGEGGLPSAFPRSRRLSRRAVLLLLATVLYVLPFVPLVRLLGDVAAVNSLSALALLPLLFPLCVLLVAVARYFADDHPQALFEVGTNLRLAWGSRGRGLPFALSVLLSSSVVLLALRLLSQLDSAIRDALFPVGWALHPASAHVRPEFLLTYSGATLFLTLLLVVVLVNVHVGAQWMQSMGIGDKPKNVTE